MTNHEKAEMLIEAQKYVIDACDIIKDAGACDKCPLYCIEDDSWFEIADVKTKGEIEDFFGLAQDIDNYISEEDYIWDHADMERKAERDEWYD